MNNKSGNDIKLDIDKNDLFCYIHIPFCTSKCKYCRFASFGNIDKLKINIYVDYLLKEIKTSPIFPLLKEEGNFLKSIYFGGGTPSILSIKQLTNIINTLKSKYKFDKNIEINIEATPNTINLKNIKGWYDIGINRISIGVQTLNNDSLVEIGRGNKGDIFNALDDLQVFFKNKRNLSISLDFIIGLPFVKKGEIRDNIEYILNKYDYIKHISVYMLEEYYNIEEEITSKFENITYPNNWNKLGLKEEEYLEEYINIKNFLGLKGFKGYEISNFAKPGFECKHNKAYWTHKQVLAFGLGAFGFLNNIRYSNSELFLEYYSGKNILKEKLIQKDLFIEKIMFDLRTSGIKEKEYKQLDLEKIQYFIKNGYLQKKSNKIILLDKGVLVLDYILKEIL